MNNRGRGVRSPRKAHNLETDGSNPSLCTMRKFDEEVFYAILCDVGRMRYAQSRKT